MVVLAQSVWLERHFRDSQTPFRDALSTFPADGLSGFCVVDQVDTFYEAVLSHFFQQFLAPPLYAIRRLRHDCRRLHLFLSFGNRVKRKKRFSIF